MEGAGQEVKIHVSEPLISMRENSILFQKAYRQFRSAWALVFGFASDSVG